MRGLTEDRSIVKKPADKRSCVVVWDKLDYLAEAENHRKKTILIKMLNLGTMAWLSQWKRAIKCLSNFSPSRI